MTKPIARDPIYRHPFDAEIIELCVRWYITYRLPVRPLNRSRTPISTACNAPVSYW
jgi:transposase-like protein